MIAGFSQPVYTLLSECKGWSRPYCSTSNTHSISYCTEACELLSFMGVNEGIWLWRRDRPVMMSFSAQNLWEFKSFRGEFEPLISVQFPQTVLNQMETEKEG